MHIMNIKDKVLIVDDVEINRDILAGALEDKYDILTAENGKQALDIILNNPDDISIVLLDLIMPVMDGYDVLVKMNETNLADRIPVIMITGEDKTDTITRCFDLGANDFVAKPFNNKIVRARVRNAIALYKNMNTLSDVVSIQNIELKEKNDKLDSINQKIVELLGSVVEYRDIESGEHIQRIKKYTTIAATQIMKDYPEYNITPDVIKQMTVASMLHDLGKVSIPDSILLKNGKLTEEEYNVMKNHTVSGSDIIERMKATWGDDFHKICYDICKYHHERYDGKGYPEGLSGEDIPIAAQIVALADCYDALVNERPYKKALPKQVAYDMIQNGECGCFSKKILDCFTKVKDKFEQCVDNQLS